MLSPKDGYVVSLFVQSGDYVIEHQPILNMDTDDEDISILRTSTVGGIRQVLAEKLSSEQLQLAQRLAQITVDAAALTRTSKVNIRDLTNDFVKEPSPLVRAQNSAAVPTASIALEKAQLELLQLNYHTTSSSEINEAAKEHIRQELAFLSAQKSRLQMKAVKSGRVSLFVDKGSFMKQGEPLLTIE